MQIGEGPAFEHVLAELRRRSVSTAAKKSPVELTMADVDSSCEDICGAGMRIQVDEQLDRPSNDQTLSRERA